MIYYNSRNWRSAIFQFHKADTFRALVPYLLFIALYTGGIVYLEMSVLKLSQGSFAKNIIIMHTLLGFAISMLLVFRTNTAYDRWWEGRKLWGSLINSSRNLAMKLHAFLPVENEVARGFFRQVIPLYASVLCRHLLKESTQWQLDEHPHPELPDLKTAQHLPNKLAGSIFVKANELYSAGQLSGEQLILLNGELSAMADICGACERIKNTPIPYSYSAFIKKFIFIYVATLPFGFAFTLGYYSIPVTTFIFYVLASLELIAEEIEDPFGRDNNDLPMEKMAETIRANIRSIIE
jgi:putative membrane protein